MTPRNRERAALLAKAVAIVVITLAFFRLGAFGYGGWQLDLGSHGMPRAVTATFYGVIGVFGLAFVYLGAGLVRATSPLFERVGATDSAMLARAFLPIATLLAFVIPWNVRAFALHGAAVTDDETTYHLASQILLRGELFSESPPFRLFFDRAFLINDGRYYTQYFLGWPLLMTPGTAIGAPGLMNPIYSALTIWPLHEILKRVASERWARFGIVMWLASPFLSITAATLLSHTTCVMSLTWGLYFVLRSRETDAPPLTHAAVAFFFGLAFWIRPLTAIGIGAAPAVWWLWHVSRSQSGRSRVLALVAFTAVAALMAGLFLGVNHVQNGSALEVAYQEALEYAVGNDFRFSHYNGSPGDLIGDLSLIPSHWETIAVTVYRMVFDGFGFPGVFVLALVGAGHRNGRLFVASALSFLAVSSFVPSPGVDFAGPIHDTELMLPASVLIVLGLERIETWEVLRIEGRMVSWTAAAAVALLTSCLVLYAPVRYRAVARMGEAISWPFDLARDEGIHDAVIFAPRPFVPTCTTEPARHWVFWRPLPNPALDEDIIWVNHVNLDLDRRFRHALFPGRNAFALRWTSGCTPIFVPLDDPELQLPDGPIGGSEDFSDVAAELERLGG